MKGAINKCRTVENVTLLEIGSLAADIIQSRTVCKGDTVIFKNPYPLFKVVLKDPVADMIIAQKTFKETIVLQKDRCTIKDSAFVDVLHPLINTVDSTYCNYSGLFAMKLDAGPGFKYHWTFDNSAGRYADISGFGKYVVAITNQQSCVDTVSFNVTEDCPLNVSIPNAFTPNDDLNNELFGPVLSGNVRSYTIQIFNRWGEKLFEGVDKGWDGNYMNEPVQQGVYMYIIRVRDARNRQYFFKGTLTILK